MKFSFRKVASVIASVVMLGSTIGIAAAANYPAPFVQSGTADVGVVVGASAAYSDWSASLDLAQNLQYELAKQTATSGSGSTSTVSGEAASLNSGTDLLYLGDDLAENVQTITKSDLPTVLADETFEDDNGDTTDYEQTIAVGSSTSNALAFSNSGSDLDDPTMLLTESTSAATAPYNLTVTFDEAVNFTTSAAEGQTITLFGKDYTIGSDTDADTLVLLGGAETQTINVGESQTFTVGNETHTVTLTGISTSDSSPKAGITVDGDATTMTQGQTKKVNGVDVFVKTVFKTGDNMGYIEVQLGSNKITLEDNSAVQTGTNNDDVDGTEVDITGGVDAMTKLVIQVFAQDSDTDYLLPGDSYVDPVFGAVKLNLAAVYNGPQITDHVDTSTARGTLATKLAGDRTIQVEATDKAGETQTLPFAYQDDLQDDDGHDIEVVEGAALSEKEYTILDSGDYQFFIQVTDLNLGHGASDDVKFKDLFTGTNYEITNKDFSAGQTITIDGQSFTVKNVSSTEVQIYSSDYSKAGSGTIQVYPYIELVSGKDTKFAYAEAVSITGVNAGTTLALPDGSVTIDDNSTVSGYSPGTMSYNITVTPTATDVATVAISPNDASGALLGNQSIIFIEDEDKAEATANTENSVIMQATDSGASGYTTMAAPSMTATSQDSAVYDDSDFHGYVDSYGTFVMRDTSDDHQAIDVLTYPKGDQMYADVYIASAGATVTPGASTGGSVSALGSVTVSDTEYSKVSSKNVVVVGGSCINSVAATLLGGAYCGSAFTDATGVGAGQFLIQSFANPNAAGKVALVVAGYDAADTTNAVKYLTTQSPDTTVGKKYQGTTATSATLV